MNKLKNIATIIIFLVVFSFIFYKVGKRQLTGYLLNHDAQRSRAIIIDDKNYMGNSPVSRERSYSYLFYVNGEAYKNDSKDPKLQIGDSIDVEYVKYWPGLNRRVATVK
ncbi:hypothetical protein [Chitinophaga ginsengisegetis]|uniref:hypothetical protein n=1 Tax=Chitinophaga ginsengisegetis TaxID=393003 RepID=UPI000DBA03F7|nr:hypothetical protein [Chitinophaga ginsengisegetis]MDR6568813.1 hypothetical protein [Chitinophaga ginsengisegetis]MDR6647956.1 hypothetical protein [Chitinophaga ginsengisegetis]MDR6654894.1 hypothetical protein [Chitinophaga ginsengisegetis]